MCKTFGELNSNVSHYLVNLGHCSKSRSIFGPGKHNSPYICIWLSDVLHCQEVEANCLDVLIIFSMGTIKILSQSSINHVWLKWHLRPCWLEGSFSLMGHQALMYRPVP